MQTPIIEATGIVKDYGTFRALHSVSLDVGTGEFVALVGPSGCGKTSLLKIVAGFEAPTDGSLRIAGADMAGVPAAGRPTRMVFQKLALFPHKTVRDNIGFPLKLAGVPAREADERIRAMLALMHLDPAYLGRYPAQLSGGEQQRVALARALVSRPSVLLLDEPMSALDAKLKKSLQAELKNLHRNLGTSFVLVTHDLEEAMMLADRICVMRAGHVLQVGTPSEIYYSPVDAFVAGFIGDTNLFPVSIARQADGSTAFRSPAIEAADPTVPGDRVAPRVGGGSALLMVRPEAMRFVTAGGPAPFATLSGVVEEFFIKGASILYRVRVEGHAVPVVMDLSGTPNLPAQVGEAVTVGFDRADCFILQE